MRGLRHAQEESNKGGSPWVASHKQNWLIGGILRDHPMLRSAFDSVLDIAEKKAIPPKELDDGRQARDYWQYEMISAVFTGERPNKGNYSAWRRLKVYRWLAMKFGAALMILAILYFPIMYMVGTLDIFGKFEFVGWAQWLVAAFLFVLGIGKIAEWAQQQWPLLFREEPKCQMTWEQLLEILRGEARKRNASLFTNDA